MVLLGRMNCANETVGPRDVTPTAIVCPTPNGLPVAFDPAVVSIIILPFVTGFCCWLAMMLVTFVWTPLAGMAVKLPELAGTRIKF